MIVLYHCFYFLLYHVCRLWIVQLCQFHACFNPVFYHLWLIELRSHRMSVWIVVESLLQGESDKVGMGEKQQGKEKWNAMLERVIKWISSTTIKYGHSAKDHKQLSETTFMAGVSKLSKELKRRIQLTHLCRLYDSLVQNENMFVKVHTKWKRASNLIQTKVKGALTLQMYAILYVGKLITLSLGHHFFIHLLKYNGQGVG